MKFLHYSLNCQPKDAIRLAIKGHVVLKIMDDVSFHQYKAKTLQDNYTGGAISNALLLISVPYKGNWHLVLEPQAQALYAIKEIKAYACVIKDYYKEHAKDFASSEVHIEVEKS